MALLVLLAAGAASARAEPGNGAASAAATVQRFHAALAAGDARAAADLLAPDAVVLEGGEQQSRQDYLAHHLGADIAFAQAVRSRAGRPEVGVSGDVAWVSRTSTAHGEFNGRPVDLAGAELVVLTRTLAGWRIRAVHWSSRRIEPAAPGAAAAPR
ncbi:MAG: nuclear transport factor 2 family protein [Burkholderiales bacterium]|nr:nuclear transport factor 2 family protein [Burkholderiales bacterium]